jgi:hypothetical protein
MTILEPFLVYREMKKIEKLYPGFLSGSAQIECQQDFLSFPRQMPG